MKVFAHRGASGEHPENTLLAMEQAIQQQAHGIEFDVQQARDGFIITHDRLITCSQQNQTRVAPRTVEELQKLDLAQQQTPPTLKQVMQCIGGRCQANVELKDVSELQWIKEELTHAIEQLGFQAEQIIVSSFNHHLLTEVNTWELGVEIGALTASLPIDYAAFATEIGAHAVHADINALNEAFVRDAKARGLQVRVYTVDEQHDIEQLFHWNVDAIFSNYPSRAIKIIEQLKQK